MSVHATVVNGRSNKCNILLCQPSRKQASQARKGSTRAGAAPGSCPETDPRTAPARLWDRRRTDAAADADAHVRAQDSGPFCDRLGLGPTAGKGWGSSRLRVASVGPSRASRGEIERRRRQTCAPRNRRAPYPGRRGRRRRRSRRRPPQEICAPRTAHSSPGLVRVTTPSSAWRLFCGFSLRASPSGRPGIFTPGPGGGGRERGTCCPV